MNAGINVAKGEFFAGLDADSFVREDALKKLLPYFTEEDIAAVLPLIKIRNPRNVLQRLQWYEFIVNMFYKKIASLINCIHVTPGPFSVYRTELSDDKPWWSMSVKDIAKMFHFSPTTVILGMIELGKQGLLDVEYDEARNAKTGLFGYREPNKYRLRPLLSQEQIDAGWLSLSMAYSDKKVDNARKLAYMIDKGNDIDVVKSFILVTDKYGEKWVTEATRLTARHRPGPSRSIAYIVGILQNWEKHGDGPK